MEIRDRDRPCGGRPGGEDDRDEHGVSRRGWRAPEGRKPGCSQEQDRDDATGAWARLLLEGRGEEAHLARVFVALRLPGAVAERMAQVERGLEQRLVDVKWVEPENLHFTLRFFGELAADAVEQVVEAVTAVTAATTAFTLRLEGLGTFPAHGRPRVLWVGVTAGRAELVTLAAQLEERFIARKLGPADRVFAPHLTLGRARDPNAPGRRGRPARERVPLQAPAAMHAAIAATRFEPVEFRADGIAVVESRLHPRGPEYLDLHRAGFAGSAGAVG